MKKFNHYVLFVYTKLKEFREFLGPCPSETKW